VDISTLSYLIQLNIRNRPLLEIDAQNSFFLELSLLFLVAAATFSAVPIDGSRCGAIFRKPVIVFLSRLFRFEIGI
jgi:hypothetical protein